MTKTSNRKSDEKVMAPFIQVYKNVTIYFFVFVEFSLNHKYMSTDLTRQTHRLWCCQPFQKGISLCADVFYRGKETEQEEFFVNIKCLDDVTL